ncbi:HAMP domain-containing protein [Priestia megaterium]|nr:HAMP domain-containing protein [Priestia megaterium]
MRKHIRNLSVFNKTVLFSTLIVILVGLGTAFVSYHLHNTTTQRILTQHVLIIANLWRETLSTESIIKVVEPDTQNVKELKELENQFQKIYKSNPSHLKGYILTTEKYKNNGTKIIVTADERIRGNLQPSMIYYGGKEFYSAFLEVGKGKEDVVTSTYKDQFGTWITAFSPIVNDQGKVVAIFAIDIDASVISTYQKKLFASLFVALLLLFTLIIFFQDWGLRMLMSPLRDLLKGIKEVSDGNFRVKLKHEDESELGQISKQFNEMTKRLQFLFHQVAATKEQFSEIEPTSNSKDEIEKAIDELEMIMERTRLQKELQRAEKMNAIGQLAASVAHEIRNPMTVVKGFLQLFQDNQRLTESEKGYIQLMISEMDRAEAIIHDYLSLARPDVKQTDLIDCAECVTSLVDLLSSYALLTNNIEIEIKATHLAYIKGNKNEFSQVLLNIMKNGIEAMKTGGKLSVSIYEKDKYVHISIQDTGIGMTPEQIERLGTAFYSLKEKGTGIGLMVSYQIIEQMNGTISVESEKGKGTTFTISLPCYQ